MISGEETQAGQTGEILSQTKQYEQIEISSIWLLVSHINHLLWNHSHTDR
jgi:hypothetical protein